MTPDLSKLKAGDTVHFRCGGKAVVSKTENLDREGHDIALFFHDHSVSFFYDRDGENGAGYGGFTLQRAQEIRCRNRIARAVVEQYASPALAENITADTADKILQDLLNNGGKLCYHTIQKDVTP